MGKCPLEFLVDESFSAPKCLNHPLLEHIFFDLEARL